VLVTGGTGSLGLRLARRLAAGGAERVLLVSRSGATEESAALAAELEGTGTEISAVSCDVTDREALAALLDGIGEDRPLTAVFHTAGAVTLGPLRDTGTAELADTFGAKVNGALLLDELLTATPLDAFVLFSSISGTWGVADHGAYGAANAVLDALAEGRRSRGGTATSVAWGPWGGGGMIDESLFSGLAATGLPVLETEPALDALQLVLDHDETALAVADVDWDLFGPVFTTSRPSPLLRELLTAPGSEGAGSGEPATALHTRLEGLSEDEARETVLHLVREHTAQVLGHRDARAVDTDRAFKDAGFDSLTAVELRNRLAGATGLRLPTTLVFDHPNPALLADHLWRRTRDAAPEAQAEDAAAPAVSDEPLAVVGMACRLPGDVNGPEDLWRLLSEGREAVGGLPADRGWDVDALYDPDPDRHGTSYTRHGGFLPHAGDFDHEFFGVSGREALAMDPQQRLLLETTWQAFENAGIVPADLKGTQTGVFAGALTPDYGQPHGMPGELEGYHVTGSAPSVASGRLAYTFGLTGPAVTVDTACSSSLVALHLASQALHSGECSLAVVAGASVMSTPTPMVSFSRQRALSGDGRCRSFAEEADGFGMAEGVGVLLVERLSQARRRGHRVLAVVRGSAVNQDGASNGLTAPNGPSQQRVIRQALRRAGLRPGDVDAVEAHGTGTRLGDPIEAQALIATYGQDRDPERPLWLGSLKSNIGHTQAAAGAVGVIKTVLALRDGTLPQTLHAEQPTSRVDWESGGVRLLSEATPWPETGRPRRAGVSAFGISGTNAHVILEQAPEPAEPEPERHAPAAVPWLLSARTPQALRAQASALTELTARGEDPVAAGHALATARARFEHRAVVVGGSGGDGFAAGLAALAEGEPAQNVAGDSAVPLGRTVFVFPGQGAQWAGMAVELTEQSPVFAARMAECEAALAEFTDWSLLEVLRGAEGAPGLDRVDVVQPASFAVMVSLAALWRSHGVEPAAVVGHSQGEIAAACVAGALSLRDAARVVCLRSRAILDLAGTGGMATVAMPAEEADNLISGYDGRLSLAAVNGPRSAVVSGDPDAVEQFVAACKARDVRAKVIPVDYASHSAQVEPILGALEETLAPVEPQRPEVPFFSTVTGDWVTDAAFDAAYWCANLRQPVRFGPAVAALTEQGYGLFVENSSHPVLLTALEAAVEGRDDAYAVGSLRRDDGGLERFLLSLAQAWTRGADVDWERAFPAPPAVPVQLPTYPFQRRRFWIEPPAAEAARREQAVADGWRYRLDWTAVPETGASELTGHWAVLTPQHSDTTGTVDAVADGLTARGATVHRLTVAELADAALPADLAGVLSLAALDERPLPAEPAVTTGLADTVEAVRALAATFPDVPLWTATRGAVGAADGDTVDHPLQAQVWGLGTVLGLDEPHRWCGRIDLPAAVDDQAVERLAEARTGLSGENELAVRESGTYARRLVPAPAGDAAPWRPRDTVLITGGTGALGAHVARWAAAEGAAHLLLVSRRGMDAPGAKELHEELTGLGAEVTVAACDVADRDALAAVLAAVPEDRPLRAVVHAAGLTQPEIPVAELTAAELARTSRVKVGGASNLDALTAGHELDAFVLFSSGAATWGDAGKGGYAAANAHLDALAQRRRARGETATSVAWGAWGGGGMVEGEVADLLTRRGMRLMRPETAVRALAVAVGNQDTRLAIASFDLARFLPLYTMSRDRRLVAELAAVQDTVPDTSAPDSTDGEQPGGALARRLAGLTEQEQEDALVELIRREVAAVLKAGRPEEIKARRAFKELGFDSLTALELRNRMNVATGLRLPATLVFDHPNPSVLARHLRRELTGGVSSVPADLDRLEASLAALPAGEWSDPALADRLRALLRRAEAAAGAPADDVPDTPDDDLAAATNDEIFDLIDRELGI
jgi:acyl transferase domain-containing protein/acyl carrier protein